MILLGELRGILLESIGSLALSSQGSKRPIGKSELVTAKEDSRLGHCDVTIIPLFSVLHLVNLY